MTGATATAQRTAPIDTLELEPLPAALPALAPAPADPGRRVVTPADLLSIAMQSGDKDIERLERLMQMDIRYREMQEADRQRDAEIAFEADFVGFTGEAIIIPKTKEVDRGRGGSFMQAEFDEVCRRLKPALAKHGFGFRHKERFGPHTPDGADAPIPWVWVTCILSHRGGHKDVLELDSPADVQTVNSPAQNAQSTASFLKRQTLLAITGTATGGEDDENRKAGASDPNAAQDGDPLLDAGWVEARKGLKALTTWWAALTEADRRRLTPHFGAMKKDAAQVGGGR